MCLALPALVTELMPDAMARISLNGVRKTISVALVPDAVPAADNPACECGAILRGTKRPAECRLFGTACTPETPLGACMVSSEGACAAHWTFGRFRDHQRRTEAERIAS